MRPSPEQQCPACHFQRIENVCGSGRRRIYQTGSGEFFRNLDCPIFEERRLEVNQTGPRVCPTCGRPLDEVVINSPQIDIVTLVGEITSDGTAWDIPVDEEPMDDISTIVGIAPEPKKHTKRRGFNDIPKARFRKPRGDT